MLSSRKEGNYKGQLQEQSMQKGLGCSEYAKGAGVLAR